MKTVGTQVVSVQDVGLYCDAPPTCPERSHEDNATVAKSREREKDRAQHLSHAFWDPFVPTPPVLMVAVGLEVGE